MFITASTRTRFISNSESSSLEQEIPVIEDTSDEVPPVLSKLSSKDMDDSDSILLLVMDESRGRPGFDENVDVVQLELFILHHN